MASPDLSSLGKRLPHSSEPIYLTKDVFRPQPEFRRLDGPLGFQLKPRKASSDSGSVDWSGSEPDAIYASRATLLDSQSKESSALNKNGLDEKSESASEFSSRAAEDQAASISFGALAAAQETLGKRKRINDDNDSDHGLRLPTSHHTNGKDRQYSNFEALERKAGKKDTRDLSRSSKHAPAEVSSKKAVSRKREVVPTKKIEHRDPRFEPLSGPFDEQKTKKNYSFLDTYRDSEIAELKATIRKTKDTEVKEKLKRALLSMESRKKAQQIKDQQQEVLRKHRKEEKERIGQGKKPFYLKKADQKKLALKERFKGMKGRQVDKLMERRRKKKAAKERKGMPEERRG